MKILWLTGTVLPYVADKTGLRASKEGTWLKILSDRLTESRDIEFVSVFASDRKRLICGKDSRCTWYGFYTPRVPETRYNKRREILFGKIIERERPDIIHIWGTEYSFAAEMINAAHGRTPAVISIQGIISECAEKYTYKLPRDVVKGYTIHDLIRMDNIAAQQRRFRSRGRSEKEALKKAQYVIGRTAWDKKITKRINPAVKYYECEEILRPEFYSGQVWSYEACRKHSIFMSQAYYPIKGMHIALEIAAGLKKKYPDLRLYTTGRDAECKNISDHFRQNSYERYISKRIKELSLEDTVIYLGSLSAKDMLKQYLRANVYMQASILENSSNSLAEAMMTGVPAVASDVGGTISVAGECGRGMLFDIEDIDKAVTLIDGIFSNNPEDQDNTLEYARVYTLRRHNIDRVFSQYIACYKDILKG